ncbi:MAG: nitroreductase family protein [Candidatus Bathyarchaeota archaeon]|nr:nitroreductase family protein [Candidatus Bathyarchaeota archaeon]
MTVTMGLDARLGMDVFEAIQKRKSVRSYEPRAVPRETLEKLLEAARLSPSAKNLQPWHFVVVTDPQRRKALSRGVFARFLSKVPVVIVACGDQKMSPDWYVVDVALAGENMVLAATAEGLSTCWVGSFDEAKVKEQLKIPEHLRVVALLAVGYGKEKIGVGRRIINLVRRRKTLDEIVSWEEYGRNT